MYMHDATGGASVYATGGHVPKDGDILNGMAETKEEEAEMAVWRDMPLNIRTRPTIIRRPRVRPPSMLSWAYSAQRRPSDGILLPLSTSTSSSYAANRTETWVAPDMSDAQGEWDDVEVLAPDITDRQTLLTLAKMTSNAYVLPGGDDWYPLGKYNRSLPFGWEEDADCLRGHIFADERNETVVISIKGTSAGVLGSGGPTAKNDKYNVSPSWGFLRCDEIRRYLTRGGICLPSRRHGAAQSPTAGQALVP